VSVHPRTIATEPLFIIFLTILSILVLFYVGVKDIFIWVFIARPHYAIIALLGILLVVTLSIMIDDSKLDFLKRVLRYCASNAIVICVFHSKIFWLVRTIDPYLGIQPSSWLSHFIVVCAEVCLLMPVIYVFNHYFPYLVGKRR